MMENCWVPMQAHPLNQKAEIDSFMHHDLPTIVSLFFKIREWKSRASKPMNLTAKDPRVSKPW